MFINKDETILKIRAIYWMATNWGNQASLWFSWSKYRWDILTYRHISASHKLKITRRIQRCNNGSVDESNYENFATISWHANCTTGNNICLENATVSEASKKKREFIGSASCREAQSASAITSPFSSPC